MRAIECKTGRVVVEGKARRLARRSVCQWKAAGLIIVLLSLGACAQEALPADLGQPLATSAAGIMTATPTPTATHPPTPTSTHTTPCATARPTASSSADATGIPDSGTTANGCAITPAQATEEAYLLSLLNAHRAAAGVPALALNPTLSIASRQHSCDMALHQQLSHTGSDGSSPGDRMAAVGLRFSLWGENIGDAHGGDPQSDITAIDQGMMAEPLTHGDHHWNIVNAGYTQLGLGIILTNGQVWLTEDFGG